MQNWPHDGVRDPRSLARRVWNTPLVDLLRGRVSARLDWRWVIEGASLGPEWKFLGLGLMRRIRLPRRQRARAAGFCLMFLMVCSADRRDPGRVVAEAGGVGPLARAMRKGWLKEQGWGTWVVVVGKRTIGRAGLAMMVTYGVLAAWFFSGRPEVKRNFAAEFNATFAHVPEAERAWPEYRAAYLALPPERDAFDADAALQWPNVPLEGEEASAALAYLESCRGVIERVRSAAGMSVLGRGVTDAHDEQLVVRGGRAAELAKLRLIPTANPAPQEWVLEHLGVLRTFSRLLLADTRLAAIRGEGDRAHANIVALLGMAAHAEQGVGLVPQLTAIAIRSMAYTALAESMGVAPGVMSVEQLEDLDGRLAEVRRRGVTLALDGERCYVLDFAQRAFTDDGRGDGRICFAGVSELLRISGHEPSVRHFVLGPLSVRRYGSRAKFIAEYDRLISALHQDAADPVWARPLPLRVEAETGAVFSNPWSPNVHRLAAILVQSLPRALVAADGAAMQLAGTHVGLRLELHRRRTGEYPATLDELAAGGAFETPADWIDGQPLRYVIRDGRGIVYSIGPDRDDDGGNMPAGGMTADLLRPRGGRAPDGDLVFWPRWFDPFTGKSVEK